MEPVARVRADRELAWPEAGVQLGEAVQEQRPRSRAQDQISGGTDEDRRRTRPGALDVTAAGVVGDRPRRRQLKARAPRERSDDPDAPGRQLLRT